MGWRRTGAFLPPEEILVVTCDVCERDIGYEDGRRPRAHYAVTRLPNPGAIDHQAPAALACSPECLRAFAAKVSSEPGGLSPREGGSGTPDKPPR